jgi:hypothetical protein
MKEVEGYLCVARNDLHFEAMFGKGCPGSFSI